MRSRTILCTLCVAVLLVIPAAAQDDTGRAELESAGALAFGPDGVLFVGDSMGAAVYAFETGDTVAMVAEAVNVDGLGTRVAAMLGTAADQVLINDMAVNPISKSVYLSVSRGTGPDAVPVLLRVKASGDVEEVSLDNVSHSKVMLSNAPAPGTGRRGQARLEAITDLAFVDGRLFIAGLSNEEFSSKLRSVSFPFRAADEGTSVEIWHASHNRFETNSPVRTFVPYTVNNEPHILAAYTCTPLVSFPVDALQPGEKILGRTIAELGSGNRPLDMIVYNKMGQDYLLMSNNRRGIMKIPTGDLASYEHIDSAVPDTAGVPYETIAGLRGVEQLDKLDSGHAVILARAANGAIDLQTIALP